MTIRTQKVPHTEAVAPFRVATVAPLFNNRDSICGQRSYADLSGYFETFEGAHARTLSLYRYYGYEGDADHVVLDSRGERVYRRATWPAPASGEEVLF